MAEKSQLDWSKYTVGKWSLKGGNADCSRLPTVQHVTHLHPALTVLREGKIKPQLIYDESRLNTDRILVTWLSPNDWHPAGGFRYGNIAFEFKWEDLIGDMRFYWVGVMNYSPLACRLLITETDRDDLLKVYDPTLRNGPWWQSSKTKNHFWNGTYCLEFMYEGELPLTKVSELKFVTHHPTRCSINYRTCSECGQDGQDAAGKFLAGACNRRLLEGSYSLWVKNKKPNNALGLGWLMILLTLGKGLKPEAYEGEVRGTSDGAMALARSVLGAYFDEESVDRKQLLCLFASHQDAIDACAAVIEDDLGLKSGILKRKK